ncbi:MAG: hypothetical protein NTV46_20130, partial [Verrucomicrobia bacterium]|nr:hypothetical protein [Verrucomicrobiota bacterium]
CTLHCAWGLCFRGDRVCMGAMKLILLWIWVVAVAGVSCERHEFEGPNGTKQLHEHAGDAAEQAAPAGKHAR